MTAPAIYEAAVGLWSTSSDAEHWPGAEFFRTREEAIAYGSREHDSPFYVGKVSLVATPELAAQHMVRDCDEADERLCDLEDLTADDHVIECSDEDMAAVRAAVAAVLRERKCVRTWFQVEDAERYADVDDGADHETNSTAGPGPGVCL